MLVITWMIIGVMRWMCPIMMSGCSMCDVVAVCVVALHTIGVVVVCVMCSLL